MVDFHFNSDNASPVCAQIMTALLECNRGNETAYGADQYSARLNRTYSDFFEHDAYVFPVPTGTAGNGLALGSITPPYGTIFCHEASHIVTTEAGAPEFYSSGARMTLLPGNCNKLSPLVLREALKKHGIGNVHHMAASAVSLTQATEAGVVYQLNEIAELSTVSHEAGMKVHLDGARFANAMVHLAATPAEMTWKAGVDILTFGTTKNGTLNAEAVITFDETLARTVKVMHKRAGHLFSKMRYMSAQLLSYLDDDLWRKNATASNLNAARIFQALRGVQGVTLAYPVEINEVFAILPDALTAALKERGIHLRPWGLPGGEKGFRLVMSYCDSPEQIMLFEQACQSISSNS